MIKRLAIIPARGNSKRIRSKNIKLFNGKPLIYYSIKALKETKLFYKIHVSTEDTKIVKQTNKYGLKIDFFRKKSLSRDNTPVESVIKFVVEKYKSKGEIFDEIFLIFATNPFIKKKYIEEAYKKYCYYKKNYSIISVTKFNKPIEWALTKHKKKKILIPKFPKLIKKNSVNNYQSYYESGMFVIYQKKYQYKKIKLKYKPYEVNFLKSVDIDNIEDFNNAEKLFKLPR